MTSMISDYPKKVPPVVADFGWYYGVQPLASHATIRQTNVILNPSFEYDLTSWTATGGTIAQSSTQSYTGSRSCALTNTQTTGFSTYINTSSDLPVTTGNPYIFSAQVYTSLAARSARIEINWKNANHTSVGFLTASGFGLTQNGWTQVSGTGVAPINTAFATPYVEMAGMAGNGEIYYIDACQFTESSTSLPYGDGDIPGWSWSGAPGNSISINQKDDFVTPLQQVITFDAIDQQGLGMPHVITPPGVSIVDYKWDFGNGQVAHGPFAATTYNYSKPPPDVQASLTVTDSHNRMYSCAHRLNLQALTPMYATTLRERG